MTKLLLILFCPLWMAGIGQAGTEGYLLHGKPPPLRFFMPHRPPPPPVNELILAMDRPPVEPVTEPETLHEDTGPVPPGMMAFNDPYNLSSLLTTPPPERPATIVNTAGGADPYAELKYPEIPASSIVPQVSEAEALEKILVLYGLKGGDPSLRKNNVVVPVAAPVFTPPQPVNAPSSRATYKIE